MARKEPLKFIDIPQMELVIKNMSPNSAKLLHQLIFEKDSGRKNRAELREFTGFDFEIDSVEYTAKIKYIKDNFTDRDLLLICTILGIDSTAVADELIKEIIKQLSDLNLLIREEDEEEEEDDKDDQSKNDDNDDKISNGNNDSLITEFNELVCDDMRSTRGRRIHSAINFRDVEDTIRYFDGKNNYSVEKWISDFEELANLLEWNELERFIFAKKALKGVAKLFILSERNIVSWEKLKSVLLEEFSTKISIADVHKELTKRRMKYDENVYEYFLHMKELASKGGIDDNSLMQYVIEGIRDSPANKVMLYGCRNIKQFKEKIRQYEAYRADCNNNRQERNRSVPVTVNKVAKRTTTNQEFKKKQHCYNCGEVGHISRNCTEKSKGVKCFKCNSFGHKSTQCRDNKNSENANEGNELINCVESSIKNKMCKNIEVQNEEVIALIDTGSSVNIIREDVIQQIGFSDFKHSDLIMNGFGGKKISAIGSVQTYIEVDDEEYYVEFQVVPMNVMQYQIILGSTFINEVELLISKDEVHIKKPNQDAYVLNITVSNIQNELDLSHVSHLEVQKEIESLIQNYKPEKKKSVDMNMKIILKNETPIFNSPRRLPFIERDIVDSQIKQWIADDIIESCSSEFASQVVVVRKKDGTPRICIDYRKLNKVAVKDRYPIPNLEDQIDSLRDSLVFSTIDLKNGFFHVEVEKNSRKYTAFVTHRGQFQFKRVPFGFCNSPANFQRYINSVFIHLQNQGIILIYMDDIIILAKDEHQAIERLKLVLQTAKDYGLDINFKKSQFLKRRIEFLGYIIENNQISPSEDKITAVIKFPEPRNVKDVQSFLGLTGYFRKFIYNYSVIARPLSDLVKKDKKFQFLNDEKSAFDCLKQILATRPVLNIYKRGALTEIHTDASAFGFGGILLQKSYEDGCLHPVYFYSKKTNDAERKYSSYELEVLAIVKTLQKFRIYLLGQKFKIVTDCSAFKQTLDKTDLMPRVARWALSLSEYDYEIEHRSGTRMKHVDAFSRYPVLTIIEDGLNFRIKEAQKLDEHLNTIREILKREPYDNYYLKKNILYKFDDGVELLVVPEKMENEVIKNSHEKGHFSTLRTIEDVRQQFYISKIKEKVEKVIQNCLKCILNNRKIGKKEGLLHPRSKGEAPFNTYHIDHMGPLESTNKNYKHILVIVDDFTKFVWLYPTKSTTSKEVIAKLEIQKKNFGNPLQIISDRGTAFTSEEFKTYCKSESINHHTVTTGLPRANGQVERINAIVISVLSKLSINEPTKWYKYVDSVQRILNSTYQRSINTTPGELLFGTRIRSKEDINIIKLIEEEIVHTFCQDREKLRDEAKEWIRKVQDENKRSYDRKRTTPNVYKEGDLVAIKRTQMGSGMKLRPKFLGPYRITKAKSNDTYDVEKVGLHEGPVKTSTCVEYLKPWQNNSLGTKNNQDGRFVGKCYSSVEN